MYHGFISNTRRGIPVSAKAYCNRDHAADSFLPQLTVEVLGCVTVCQTQFSAFLRIFYPHSRLLKNYS